jgi:hypothetical protein
MAVKHKPPKLPAPLSSLPIGRDAISRQGPRDGLGRGFLSTRREPRGQLTVRARCG